MILIFFLLVELWFLDLIRGIKGYNLGIFNFSYNVDFFYIN